MSRHFPRPSRPYFGHTDPKKGGHLGHFCCSSTLEIQRKSSHLRDSWKGCRPPTAEVRGPSPQVAPAYLCCIVPASSSANSGVIAVYCRILSTPSDQWKQGIHPALNDLTSLRGRHLKQLLTATFAVGDAGIACSKIPTEQIQLAWMRIYNENLTIVTRTIRQNIKR